MTSTSTEPASWSSGSWGRAVSDGSRSACGAQVTPRHAAPIQIARESVRNAAALREALRENHGPRDHSVCRLARFQRTAMTSKPAEYRFQADVNARNIPELRRLYLHRPLGYPLSYAILAAAALGAGVFAFLSKSREAAFWVLVSAAIVYIGFALPKIAYARWSRQFAGNPVNGTVDGNGIYLHSHMQEFPWSQTVAAKISPKAALVYASKTDALPLQPEFFASEAEWHQ